MTMTELAQSTTDREMAAYFASQRTTTQADIDSQYTASHAEDYTAQERSFYSESV